MTMEQVLRYKSFVVVGNTLNEEKYACIIKHALLKHDYEVQSVGWELASINDINGDIDIIDLCIRSDKGLELIKNCTKPFKCVVIQPGASSPELEKYLSDNNIPFMNDCLLRALGEH